MDTVTRKSRQHPVLFVLSLILVIFFFVFVYYGAYESYVASEHQITTAHFSEMAGSGRALLQNYIGRLTDGAMDCAQILSYLQPESSSFSSYLLRNLQIRGAAGAAVELQDGTILYSSASVYLETRQRPSGNASASTQHIYYSVFSDTVQEAFETKIGCALSDLKLCGGTHYFCLAVPFSLKDGRSAVLTLFYPQSALNEPLNQAPSSQNSRMYILDSSGDFVASQTAQEEWLSPSQFLHNTVTGNQLTAIRSLLDSKQYIVYAKSAGLNNWYILYVMPKAVLDAQLQAGSERIHLFGTLGLLFGIVVFGVGLRKNRIRARHLELFREKFRIATLQSARAAFEYDKKTDHIRLISECEHIHFPKESLSLTELAACVHPEDRPAYGQSVLELRRDNATATNVRCIHFSNDGVYRWYHVTATRLSSKGEGKALTIGTVEDIDESERERLDLAQKATTDCLTGLYNRAETERIIQKHLSALADGDHAAFAIFDLDHFKEINDVYGHKCGDRALLFFAEKLRGAFRFGDVVGRLGGDEFLVYMTATGESRMLEHRMQEFMDSLKVRREDEKALPPVSCSAGCCIARCGSSFEQLYKAADAALYESKTKGRSLLTIV